MLYVGTCGFAYKDWVGPFYPGTIRQAEMLPYYAGSFRAVEIDASFYGVLPQSTVARMSRVTPPDFRFCFKVPQTVTHAQDLGDAQAFLESVTPVLESSKFGCALMQFPNSFKPGEAGTRYLRRVVESLSPIRLAAEFRNCEWQTAQTHELLSELAVGWCNVDMPQYETLMHPSSDVTAGIGYVRFHGRNAAQWWTGDNATRYEYEYTAEELEPWAERVAEIDGQTAETYAFFNNHARGNATRNAQTFTEMLRERYGDLAPPALPETKKPPSQGRLFD